MHIRNEIPSVFPNNTYVSFDSEYFRMVTNKLHRPHGKFAIMTICAVPDFVYYVTKPDEIQYALKNADNCVWVMQNAKFDITQLRPYAPIPPRTRLVDTMLIERILWNGYYDSFSLDSMVRRYLNEERPEKDYWQKWFADHDELTDEAIQYACQDASDQLRVWLEQKKLLTKTDMKIWREIDQPALWAVLDFQGFRIDPEAWKSLAENNKEKVKEIDNEIEINPRSPVQVLKLLRNLGFTNLQNTQEKSLQKAIRKYPKATEAIKEATKILDSRKYAKRVSTYGEHFLDNMVEEENGLSLIYSDYQITGAETGRMSASGGMHNIPIRDTKDFRKCFIARPRHKLIICDYDAQEARITAYLTQDERLKKYFRDSKKVYIEVARELTGQIVEKGHPEYLKAKNTFLGMDYGLTEFGLATRTGMTIAESIDYIEAFFDLFPGIKRWVTKQRELRKITYTVSGRKVWLNPYNDQCERNALNNPHQGTASDITKKALGYIHKVWRWDYPFGVVGVYHDEIVPDVPEKIAEQVKNVVSGCMVDAAQEICYGIPFKVDATIADDWSEK